jgi:hypothetical protein
MVAQALADKLDVNLKSAKVSHASLERPKQDGITC